MFRVTRKMLRPKPKPPQQKRVKDMNGFTEKTVSSKRRKAARQRPDERHARATSPNVPRPAEATRIGGHVDRVPRSARTAAGRAAPAARNSYTGNDRPESRCRRGEARRPRAWSCCGEGRGGEGKGGRIPRKPGQCWEELRARWTRPPQSPVDTPTTEQRPPQSQSARGRADDLRARTICAHIAREGGGAGQPWEATRFGYSFGLQHCHSLNCVTPRTVS